MRPLALGKDEHLHLGRHRNGRRIGGGGSLTRKREQHYCKTTVQNGSRASVDGALCRNRVKERLREPHSSSGADRSALTTPLRFFASSRLRLWLAETFVGTRRFGGSTARATRSRNRSRAISRFRAWLRSSVTRITERALGGPAPPRQPPQPPLHGVGQVGRPLGLEPQLHRGRHLVHVLTTGAARACELLGQFPVFDGDRVRDPQHGPRDSPVRPLGIAVRMRGARERPAPEHQAATGWDG